jgi:hypothetical protein
VIARVLIVLALLATAARADDQPWSVGVTPEQKAHAQELLDGGNAAFVDNRFEEALAIYRKAIAIYDHPAIRFNIVRCLIQLGQPIEAEDNLKLALKYGRGPLKEDLYTEALSYQKLLAQQIATLDIKCGLAGAAVSIDGKAFGTCPTSQSVRILPGPHQVVVRKAGYVTRIDDLVLVGGSTLTTDLTLKAVAASGRVTHRWATWMPWTVFGAGLGVVGVGALIEVKGASDMNAFERAVRHDCPMVACPDGTVDTSLEDSAKLENRVGIGVMAAGVATAATGAVMLYMNRARIVYPVEVTPRGDGAVVSISGAF